MIQYKEIKKDLKKRISSFLTRHIVHSLIIRSVIEDGTYSLILVVALLECLSEPLTQTFELPPSDSQTTFLTILYHRVISRPPLYSTFLYYCCLAYILAPFD